MDKELKPCPFCGSEAKIEKSDDQLLGGCFNEDCKMAPILILDAERAPDNISVILWPIVEDIFMEAWNRRG